MNAFMKYKSGKSCHILSSSYVRRTCEINFRQQNRQYIQLQSVISDTHINSVHPDKLNYIGLCHYKPKHVWDVV